MRTSTAMKKALALVLSGEMNSYEAAIATGVTSSGIRRRPEYREAIEAGRIRPGTPGYKLHQRIK